MIFPGSPNGARPQPVAAFPTSKTPRTAMTRPHRSPVTMRRPMTTLAGVATLILASSCVIVSDSQHDVSGSFVSRSTLEQIEQGASKAHVTTLLGEPTGQTSTDALTEVWRWTSHESRNSSARVFLLLSDTHHSQVARNTFVEFDDGVVSKAWQD